MKEPQRTDRGERRELSDRRSAGTDEKREDGGTEVRSPLASERTRADRDYGNSGAVREDVHDWKESESDEDRGNGSADERNERERHRGRRERRQRTSDEETEREGKTRTQANSREEAEAQTRRIRRATDRQPEGRGSLRGRPLMSPAGIPDLIERRPGLG
ncbi:unnamed protein product [Boreogadus saida]